MLAANKQYLTTIEAAAFMRIQPQTARSWRAAGHGPRFVRLGRGRRSPVVYDIAELERFIEASTFASTAEETVAVETRPA